MNDKGRLQNLMKVAHPAGVLGVDSTANPASEVYGEVIEKIKPTNKSRIRSTVIFVRKCTYVKNNIMFNGNAGSTGSSAQSRISTGAFSKAPRLLGLSAAAASEVGLRLPPTL